MGLVRMAQDDSGSSQINTFLIEAVYKVILRWYMITARLVWWVPEASSLCFRGCGQDIWPITLGRHARKSGDSRSVPTISFIRLLILLT